MAVTTLATAAAPTPQRIAASAFGWPAFADQRDEHRQQEDDLDPLAEDRHERREERRARTSRPPGSCATAARDLVAEAASSDGQGLALEARLDPAPERVEPGLERLDLLRPAGLEETVSIGSKASK